MHFPLGSQEILLLLAQHGGARRVTGVSVGLGRSPTDLGTIPSSHACKLCDLGHVSLPP